MRLCSCLGTLFVVVALASSADGAPILQVNGSGILTGAIGVNVKGTLYDVEFVDGSCVELFTGCDDAGDMLTDAGSALDAVLAQVFVDSSRGAFDSHPELTFGCTEPRGCLVLTPRPVSTTYWGGVVFDVLFNYPVRGDGVSGPIFEFPGTDYSLNPFRVYARFDNPRPAPPPPPLPEPATLTFVGLGVAGMGVRRWRQRKAS